MGTDIGTGMSSVLIAKHMISLLHVEEYRGNISYHLDIRVQTFVLFPRTRRQLFRALFCLHLRIFKQENVPKQSFYSYNEVLVGID
jgi:hypothetical protein